MDRTHLHMIVTAKVKHADLCGRLLEDLISEIVTSIGMKVINGPHSCYSDIKGNEGWTAIAVLDFSSISIHLWQFENLLEFDLFSCKDFDVNRVLNLLDDKFGILVKKVKILNRDYKFNV